VLDFGAQVKGGTIPLDGPGGTLTDQQVQSLALAFASGLQNCGGKNYIVAIGTNNSGSALTNDPAAIGTDWANVIVNSAKAVTPAEQTAGISIQGASDIEPGSGFDSAAASLSWAQAYATGSAGHVYFNYGSADGCPLPTGTNNPPCTTTWNEGNVWKTGAGIYNTGGVQISIPLPEIYVPGQSSDWIAVATWGVRNDSGRHANFAGSFAYQGITPTDKSPQDAWQTLYTDLNSPMDDPGVIQTSLPYVTNDFKD